MRQFSLRWIFAATGILSAIFAVAATNGYAIVVLFMAGVSAPAITIGYIVFITCREKLFGERERPLASSTRDPLDIVKGGPRQPIEDRR